MSPSLRGSVYVWTISGRHYLRIIINNEHDITRYKMFGRDFEVMKWNRRELDPSKSEWDVWIFVVGFAKCLVINPSLSATIYVDT